MDKDIGLDNLTEAYLTQRLYAPHIEISNELKMAIKEEFQRLISEDKHPKRIATAIEYYIKTISATMRQQPRIKELK